MRIPITFGDDKSKSLSLPELQREYVWDNGRSSRLIESFILNIPVPPIYFAERQDAVLEIIDGHQRVLSIVRFINNEFGLTGLRVLSEYKRKRFHQLPAREQRFIKTRSLRTRIQRGLKSDIFLVSGGVSEGDYDLVPDVLQELGVRMIFHKVAQKPGKPLWFGRRGDTLVFGLPGNPVSAFLGYRLYVRSAIRKMQGDSSVDLCASIGQTTSTIKKKIGRFL